MVSLARDRRLYPDRRSAFALDVMLRWVADHAFRSGVTRLAMAALVICAAAVSSRWALAVLTGLPALFGSAVNAVGAYQEERNIEPRNPLVRWSVLNAVQGAGRLVPNLGGVLEGAGAIGLLLTPSFIAVDTAGWLRVTAQIAAVVYTSSVLASVVVDPAWYNPNERPPAIVDWLRMGSGPIIALATWWVTVLVAQWTTEQATLLTLATAIPALVVLRITETDRLLAYAAAQAQTSELDGRDLVLAQAHALMSAPVRVAWVLAHESRERDRELYDHIRMMRTRFFQLGHLEELEHSDLTLPDSLVRPVLRLARAFGTHPITRVLISEISSDDHDLARIVIDDLVTNAGQADARTVTVTVERLATHLVITVEDDADLIRGDVWKAPGSSLARLDRILTRRGGDLVLDQAAGSPKKVVARWVADDTTF
jgi:hypothetical protein